MNERDDLHQNVMSSIILSRLKDIATSVMHAATADTVGDTLERIAHTSRDLIKARYAALGIPNGYGGLEFFKFSGIDPETQSAIGHLPEGRGLLGKVMRDREPLRLDHIRDHPESVGFPPHHPAMDSFLGVPVIVGDHLFGMLYLSDREDGQPFDETDQFLIETLAGYAALAIAGVQLREQKQRLTQLEERERIAMELHDGVIQSLYAIGMQVELMRTASTIGKQDLLGVMQSLNSVIEDIRAYILNLKTSSAGKRTLKDIVENALTRLYVPENLHISIQGGAQMLPFSPATIEAVCQMVMEAISNVIRHADARHLTIQAVQQGQYFELRIIDDGRGFDLGSVGDHGLGLQNIQRRARLNGGALEIITAPGEGTTLTLRLPVHI
jgi:signal transduction histidine kinase